MTLRLLCAAAVAAVVSLQPARAQGVLKFDTDNHDFKNVSEGTLAGHEFKFTNVGNQPVVISNVQASCGCTTPEWTKTPVLPGKSGFVKAVYNSNGRPGVFNKTITVTSNSDKPSVVLSIKGTVLTRDEMRKTVSADEVAKSPKLTLDGPTEVSLGKLEVNRPATARFTVKNTGKQTLNVTGVYATCNCVTFKDQPAPIKPGESGTVYLTMTPRDLGERLESVALYSNDLTQDDPKVKIRASVVQNLAQGSMLRESDSRVPFK